MTKQGMLIVISGPSGVGKDTLAQEFLKGRTDCEISVSATTRAPRAGEQEGVNYFYSTAEKFKENIANGELLEYAQYNGNYYGTLKSVVDNIRALGKHVILIIETEGAKKIRQVCPEAMLIFIMPPDLKALEKRLIGRQTEHEEAVRQRLKIACDEILESRNYDYIVVNEDVKQAVSALENIVAAAECSPKHVPDLLRGVCERLC